MGLTSGTAARIAAKRLVVVRRALTLACLNAAVLETVALADSAGGLKLLRTVCVCLFVSVVNVAAVAASPRVVPVDVDPHAPPSGVRTGRVVVAGLSVAGLILLAADPPASGVLFVALLTPAEVAALLDDWPAAALGTALVALGLVVAAGETGGPTLSGAFSDVVASLAVIAALLWPARCALRSMRESPDLVAGWRQLVAAPRAPHPLTNREARAVNTEILGRLIRQGLTDEQIDAIHPRDRGQIAKERELIATLNDVAELVRMDRSCRAIADELGMTVHRAEYLTNRLRAHFGVADKRALREHLNALPAAIDTDP